MKRNFGNLLTFTTSSRTCLTCALRFATLTADFLTPCLVCCACSLSLPSLPVLPNRAPRKARLEVRRYRLPPEYLRLLLEDRNGER